MDFITNSVDAKPVVYQIWIGLERQNSTGESCLKIKFVSCKII